MASDKGGSWAPLSAVEVLALRKCEAAEHFTTVPGEVKPRTIYLDLQRRGLLEWRNGMRLTEAGKAELIAQAAKTKGTKACPTCGREGPPVNEWATAGDVRQAYEDEMSDREGEGR